MTPTSIPPVEAHPQNGPLHVGRYTTTTIAALVVVVAICLVALFAGFFAPYPPNIHKLRRSDIPPQRLHFLDPTASGKRLRLHTYGYSRQRDPYTLQWVYQRDVNQKIYVGLFVHGEPYTTLFGLIESERHLLGPITPGEPVHLLGTDSLGRDVLSRMIFGMRNSLVDWSGIILSGAIGAFLIAITLQRRFGGMGRRIQRMSTVMNSMPTWIFRLLLLGLLSWHWPLLSLLLRSLVWRQTIIPEFMPALGPALVAFFVICLMTLLLHRGFLRWLTLMWTTLAIWKLSSLRMLAGWIGGYDGVGFFRARITDLAMLGEFGMFLLLLLSVLPGMLLVVYGIMSVQQQMSPLVERRSATLLRVLAFLLAMIPMLYPLETSFVNYGLGYGLGPTLQTLFGELSNLLLWEQTPWLLWHTMPALVLLLGFVLLADGLFSRAQSQSYVSHTMDHRVDSSI